MIDVNMIYASKTFGYKYDGLDKTFVIFVNSEFAILFHQKSRSQALLYQINIREFIWLTSKVYFVPYR